MRCLSSSHPWLVVLCLLVASCSSQPEPAQTAGPQPRAAQQALTVTLWNETVETAAPAPATTNDVTHLFDYVNGASSPAGTSFVGRITGTAGASGPVHGGSFGLLFRAQATQAVSAGVPTYNYELRKRLDTSVYTQPRLTFWRRLVGFETTQVNGQLTTDRFVVRYSTATNPGPSDWTEAFVSPTTGLGSWGQDTVTSLPAAATLWISFLGDFRARLNTAVTPNVYQFDEWVYLDDVVLTGEFGCSSSADCSDGTLCTSDVCDVATGLCSNPVIACNDGNACTADACNPSTGVCASTPIACDDGNACTLDACDVATGACTSTAVSCNDGNLCTADACNPATGACTNAPITCDDGDLCTTDSCDPATGVCANPAVNCGDGDLCTTDSCNSATGACTNTAVGCGDGNLCTTDSCNPATGACSNEAVSCSDGNLCTTDSCNAATGACSHEAVSCSDGNLCTTDTCNASTGACSSVAVSCSDGNACTTDSCNASTGACSNVAVSCSDGNACTTDSCNTSTGACAHATINCSDNLFCNGVETCNTASGCVAGTPPTVNDGIACTTDACNEATDQVTHVANNAACNDSNTCTSDSCSVTTGCRNTPGAPGVSCAGGMCTAAGVCSSEPGGPCTYAFNNTPCDPGASSCQLGECVLSSACGDGWLNRIAPHPAEDCDDGNNLPNDACTPECEPRVLTAASSVILHTSSDVPAIRSHALATTSDGRTLIVWQTLEGSNSRLLARRMTQTGLFVVNDTIVLEPSMSTSVQAQPEVVALQNGDWVVLYTVNIDGGAIGRRRLMSRAVHRDGTFGPAVRLSSNAEIHNETSVRATPMGDGFAVAWFNQRSSSGSEVSVHYTERATGHATTELSISPWRSGTADSIAVTVDDNRSAVAWVEGGSGFGSLYLWRSESGTAQLTGTGLSSVSLVTLPATTGPRPYKLAWLAGSVVRALEVSTTGTLGSASTVSTLAASTTSGFPRIAPLGNARILVGYRYPSAASFYIDLDMVSRFGGAPSDPDDSAWLRDALDATTYQYDLDLSVAANGVWVSWVDDTFALRMGLLRSPDYDLDPQTCQGCEPALSCGDGWVEAGEACDDGNDIPGDGCESDCTVSPDCVPSSATDATCNNVDDDCDALIDDDFPGQPTSCGLGACARQGTTACSNGQQIDTCVPGAPISSSDPTCNSIDDDCDGVPDDNYAAQATSCGDGVCASTGATSCSSGAVTDSCAPGEPLSSTDPTCDDLDEDCDGALDDDYVSQPTSCGVGACASTGSTECVDGGVVDDCTPAAPLSSTDPSCDDIDDDCDALVDDDFPGQSTSCGVGVCARSGGTACVSGTVVDSCAPGAPLSSSDVTCNSTDEDCDGALDDDYASHATHCGVGACASTGSTACVAGSIVDGCVPSAPLSAADATCDDLDDDCDGVRDDDFAGQSTACGVGVCARGGATACESGAVVDSCAPGAPLSSTDATCNSLDEDCDGALDDDYVPQATSCGVGACMRAGTTACTNGSVTSSCTPGAPIAADDSTCDGIDDDCDGLLDENCTCVQQTATLSAHATAGRAFVCSTAATTFFAEGFESNTLAGWTTTGSFTTSNALAQAGTYSAHAAGPGTSAISRTFNTLGLSTATLAFNVRTRGPTSAGYGLNIRRSTNAGATWSTIASAPGPFATWQSVSFANQPISSSLLISFEATPTDATRFAHYDSITLTGTCSTPTYFATGSQSNLGTGASTSSTLYNLATEPGVWRTGACPQ